jgi:hypothetical protein
MGSMGKCCCACDCLPLEDLPTVTISGYTGGGWSGSCCYEQTFTPNTTPSWSKSCSGMLYEGSVNETCVTQHWIQKSPDYRGYEIFPSGCDEIPEDYCCYDDSEHIATTTTNWEFLNNAFIAVWRRVKDIKVRISQEEVDCSGVEGETGGCKIVIRSRYTYEYVSKVYSDASISMDQSVTLINSTCFEVNDGFVFDDPAPPLLSCGDVPSTPPEDANFACIYDGEIYFDRVKYFDEMPLESLTFENADIPGCDSSSCDYEPYNYVSQVCIYGPSSAVDDNECFFNLPCYCISSPTQRSVTATSDDTICEGNSVTEVGPCDPAEEVLCVSSTTSCRNPGDPPNFSYDCNDGESASIIGYIPTTGGVRCPSSGIGNDGGMSGGGIILNSVNVLYIGCGGCEPGLYCYPSDPSLTTFVYPWARLYDCNESPCDQGCCRFYDDCPNCFPDGVCKELYERPWSTVTSHTRSQTCTGLQSASVCTSAPTWTITLS